MRIRNMSLAQQQKLRSLILFPVLAALAILLMPTVADSQQYQISLKSGSVMQIETQTEGINWTDVLATGEMVKRRVSLSNIKELILTDSPASKQIAEIRRLVNMLESPNYHDRERAEEKLSEASVGGRFTNLLKAAAKHPKLEVSYRANRILDRLKTSNAVDTINEFDYLILKDGSKLEGDAGEFKLDFIYREKQLSVEREQIRLLSSPQQIALPKLAKGNVEVQVFHKHDEAFYQPHQTLVDFENAPGGSDLKRGTDVSDMFLGQGLLITGEGKGYAGISGYGFKFKPLPPVGQSVCVCEKSGTYTKKFKGVLEIRFCLPNQRAVAAGVHELGMFIARVDHERDLILEAYNGDGQILACVESTRGCAYSGLKSTEPIAFVRVLSNPYLFRVTRKIDEDFAIDDICFSKPVPISNNVNADPNLIRLKNRDLIKGSEIKTEGGKVSVATKDLGAFQFSLDEVASIRFANMPVKRNPRARDWFAMLPDRSVISITPGESMKSQLFQQLEIDPSKIMGLWFARNNIRFPLKEDFQKGKNVMVFPTCRFVSNEVEYSGKGYSWKTIEKLQQKLKEDPPENAKAKKPAQEEDPTPRVTSVDYSKASLEDIPTLWSAPPQSHQPGTGMVRLTDGQQLVLGGSSGFEISKLDQQGISISINGQETTIPISKIVSIDFPAESQQ